MRCTVEEGMNKMLESEILIPEATQISMVPMPTTWAELPPNPLTLMGGMGQSNLKLEHLGETWQFALESRIKGAVGRWDMAVQLAVKAMGLAGAWERSVGEVCILQSM